jgi:PleD family two-component response regulator
MIDIDYLKQYNEQYGRLAEDQSLKFVSQIIVKHLRRPFDFFADYGCE